MIPPARRRRAPYVPKPLTAAQVAAQVEERESLALARRILDRNRDLKQMTEEELRGIGE